MTVSIILGRKNTCTDTQVALYPHQSTAHARGYVVHRLSGKRAHTLDEIGLKCCSQLSPMLSLLTHALDVWRMVHLHAEPPDWIRVSFCSPYLLQTHKADLSNLLRQDCARRPHVSILAMIDSGWVARLVSIEEQPRAGGAAVAQRSAGLSSPRSRRR